MAERILQINFRYNVPRDDYEAAVAPLGPDFGAVEGLRWKIWIINEAENEAGGIYLFESDAALQTFLAGPLAAGVKSHPALSELTAKVFEVMPDLTAVCRGPV